MATWQIVLLGCLSSLIPDVLRALKDRHGVLPDYLYRPFFWVCEVVLVMIGGLVAFLVHPASIIEAVALGYSAPEVLTRMLASPGEQPVQEGGRTVWRAPGARPGQDESAWDSMRRWWSI